MDNSEVIVVIFEDMLHFIKHDSPISTINQIKNIIIKTNATIVTIGNVMISSKELIDRLMPIDIPPLVNNDKKTKRFWYKLGVPNSIITI